jgi:hypothetical protein
MGIFNIQYSINKIIERISHTFIEFSIFSNVEEHFSTRHIFHEKINIVLILKSGKPVQSKGKKTPVD